MELLTKASFSSEPNQRELDNLQVAYQAACEGMVLLKNDGILPLKTKKIALYGPGATRTIKGGTGSGEVNERHSVTILEGLQDRGFEITSGKWLQDYEESFAENLRLDKEEKKKQLNILKPQTIMQMMMGSTQLPVGRPVTDADVQASSTDTCVYVLARQAGEGGDRKAEKGDFFLTDAEAQTIRFCAERYERFLLVINCGSAMDMGFAEEIDGINGILYLSQPGTEGGHAFADVISGKVSPSGKLADTWAKKYQDVPFADQFSYLNGDLKNEFYQEGIYVGYRYFDSFHVEPAYPFGFGLTYSRFDIDCAGVTAEGTEVSVRANVINRGEQYSGKEVAQLYVSPPAGTLHREYQALAAYGKTETLAPGESQVLELSFDLKQLAAYRESDASYVLEPGEYVLRLGHHSRDTVAVGALVVEQELVVSRHEHICPLQEPLEELTADSAQREELAPGLPRIPVAPEAVQTVVYDYTQPEECADPQVQKFLSDLTVKDMAEIVVGIGMFGGKTRFTLPGSVGNTTSKSWDKGLANVALCDGPAGLRIQRHSTVDQKGTVKPVELALSIFESFPSFIKNMMRGNPEKDTSLYQYTTAFPVTAALAQTWNRNLMEQVGNAIYWEMKEYGCTYWLAPAVNIHRNPLCGRNFEYYSEDPFLTGSLAAALTRGVQQEEGFYVTVKHFACNNQEDNRNFVSSNLSERALREIYLRAFEWTVREGGAKGIMTSYNKINGIYAPNSYDLCTKVLRCEWGFDGVVMTDWFSTGGGKGDTAVCMQAGNDLIMPGGGSFKKDILSAVKSGKIKEADLRRCCGNVIKSILNSATQREYLG